MGCNVAVMRLAAISWLLAGLGSVAHAEPGVPEDSAGPRALLQLPDLTPSARLDVATASGLSSSTHTSFSLEVRGAIAVTSSVELFLEVPVRAATTITPPFGASMAFKGGPALGNLRSGGRYSVRAGEITIAPSAWAWIPTSTASNEAWEILAQIEGLGDARTFLDQGALGGALDLGWRHGRALVQAEVGAAIIADDGPQIDNVFGAIGGGRRVGESTSLLAEWRVEAFPRRSWIHAISLGIARRETSCTSWRLRVQSATGGSFLPQSEGSLAIGLDLLHRFD